MAVEPVSPPLQRPMIVSRSWPFGFFVSINAVWKSARARALTPSRGTLAMLLADFQAIARDVVRLAHDASSRDGVEVHEGQAIFLRIT